MADEETAEEQNQQNPGKIRLVTVDELLQNKDTCDFKQHRIAGQVLKPVSCV